MTGIPTGAPSGTPATSPSVSPVTTTLLVLRHSAHRAFADLAAIYTWRTWTFGWLLRLIMQVIFFALIGRLLGSRDAVAFLLVGNAVAVTALEASVVILITVGERRKGTLPILVAAPSTPFTGFLGQGVNWPVTGVVSATVTLFGVAPLLGVPLPWPRALLAVPLIALVAVSSYLFGLFVGALVLRRMTVQWLALNLSYLGIMTICGVNVPVDFWPAPVQALATVLPVTHGLLAVRALLDGDPLVSLLPHLAAEAAVGAGWLLAAALAFRRFIETGRRDGTIELAP